MIRAVKKNKVEMGYIVERPAFSFSREGFFEQMTLQHNGWVSWLREFMRNLFVGRTSIHHRFS